MRRLLPVLAGVLGLLLIAAGALWLWRLPLAEWAVARWLDERGLAHELQVVRLGVGGATLADVTLEGQQAGRVLLDYDLATLIAEGWVERIELVDLRLAADLTDERPLGKLLEAFAGSEPAAEAGPLLPVLPPLALRDAMLDLTTARGPLRLRLDGGLLAHPQLAGPARRLELQVETLEGPVRLGGTVEGTYRPGDGEGTRLAFSLDSQQGPPVSLATEAAIADGRLGLALDLSGDAPLLADLAGLPTELRPEAGRLDLDGDVSLLAEPLLAGDFAALLAEASALRALDATLTLQDLLLPGRLAGLDLESGLTLASDAGGRGLRLAASRATADSLDAGWLQGLGLPAPFAALLGEGGALSLTSSGVAPAVLRLGTEPVALALDLEAGLVPAAGGRLTASVAGTLTGVTGPASGTLTGSLGAEALTLPDYGSLGRLQSDVALELGARGTTLRLTGPATLEALALAPAALARVEEGWRPLLDAPLDAAIAPAAGAQGGEAARLDLGADRLHLALPASLRLAAGEARLEATLDGTLALSQAGTLEDSAVELASLNVRERPTPGGLLRSLALSGRFEGVPQAAHGRAEMRFELVDLAVEGAGAADLSGELATELAWDQQALTLDLVEPGSLALSGFAEPLAPTVQQLELALASASLTRTGAALAVAAEAALAPARFDLDGRGRQDDLSLSAGRLALDLTLPAEAPLAGTLQSEDLDADFSDAALAIRDARLTARLAGDEIALELQDARVLPTGETPLFPTLTVSGEASFAGDDATYRARGRGLEGALALTVAGSHDFAAGRGRAEVEAEPLNFEPGGLQPAALHPALAALEAVSGRLDAGVAVRFGRGTQASGTVAADDLSFTVAGTEVRGFDLALALDSLAPVTSPPGQPFSIERIDAGVPVTDVAGTLQLRASEAGTEIVIGRAQADFLEGALALDDAVLVPAAGRYDLTLQVRRVDLERLLALADLQEVSGTGQLSGAIPITVERGAVAVHEGALAALSDGVIAFRSPEAREALASGGESVELMLRALENFHYEVLRLTLDKPAEGESRVFLKLEGSNPEVLDGQPFVFNINLTSNAAPLLAALARGTEISDRLVEELLQERLR